jgi:YtkA-like
MELFMFSKTNACVFAAGVALAALGFSSSPASAAASDYRFEVVQAKPLGAGKTDLAVRLVHVPDGKPVAGAVIIQTKTDMTPSGMAEMTGKVTAGTAEAGNGVYHFQAETGMPGQWALTLAAKVQGEPQTVRGTIAYDAAK